jgi:hypothetical protein
MLKRPDQKITRGEQMRKSIKLTKIDLAAPFKDMPQTVTVLPLARLDQVDEFTYSKWINGQSQPVAETGSKITKVNGDYFYVAEKPEEVQALIEEEA